MSWDVLLLKSKIDTNDMDAQPDIMGDRDELIDGFKKLSSDVDFSDKSWGIFFDGQTSIEINIGGDAKVNVTISSGTPWTARLDSTLTFQDHQWTRGTDGKNLETK